MAIWLAHGCASFWAVHGKRQIVEVTENETTRRYKTGATIVNTVLGAAIRVSEIFT